jgi:ParB-like chromosome segregation protein Spo0J
MVASCFVARRQGAWARARWPSGAGSGGSDDAEVGNDDTQRMARQGWATSREGWAACGTHRAAAGVERVAAIVACGLASRDTMRG